MDVILRDIKKQWSQLLLKSRWY